MRDGGRLPQGVRHESPAMAGLRRLGGLPHLAGHGSQRPGVHPAAGGGGITKREREFAEMEARDAGKPIAETRGFDIRFSAYASRISQGSPRKSGEK